MTIWTIVFRELIHRKGQSALIFLSILLASGAFLASRSSLYLHERKSQQILKQGKQELDRDLQNFQREYEKIGDQIGFNFLILPKHQQLSDYYADNFAEETMPVETMDSLLKAELVTVKHWLVSLQRKLIWPEQGRSILLTGITHQGASTKPQLAMPFYVQEGEVILGHEIAESLGLYESQVIKLLGRTYKVSSIQAEAGGKEDISIWMPLAEVQDLFHLPNQINEILAMNAQGDQKQMSQLRSRVEEILPNIQVLEFQTQSLALAESQSRVTKHKTQSLAAEKKDRDHRKKSLQQILMLLNILVFGIAGLWISVLMMSNVRERRIEIALWNSLGFTPKQILGIFTGKALVLGTMAGTAAACLGITINIGMLMSHLRSLTFTGDALTFMMYSGEAWLFSVLLSLLATLFPVRAALAFEPAEVLRHY